MDILADIIRNIIRNEKLEITFPNCEIDFHKLVYNRCVVALQQIKAIIDNDSLSDEECFIRIEHIVCVLEEIGSDGGNRHDF